MRWNKKFKSRFKRDITKKDAITTIILGAILTMGTGFLAFHAVPLAIQNNHLVRWKRLGVTTFGGNLVVVLLFLCSWGVVLICSGMFTMRRLNRKQRDGLSKGEK